MKGSVFFAVALADVQVEHPGDQGALQARAGPAEHVEARAGDLDALLEVEDAQLGAQVPVGQGSEVEFFGRPHRPDAPRFRARLCPSGTSGSGQVGQGGDLARPGSLHLADLLIQGGDLIADLAHSFDLGLAFGGIFAILPISLETVLRSALSASTLGDQRAPLGIQVEDAVDHGGVHRRRVRAWRIDIRVFREQIDI